MVVEFWGGTAKQVLLQLMGLVPWMWSKDLDILIMKKGSDGSLVPLNDGKLEMSLRQEIKDQEGLNVGIDPGYALFADDIKTGDVFGPTGAEKLHDRIMNRKGGEMDINRMFVRIDLSNPNKIKEPTKDNKKTIRKLTLKLKN